MEQFGDLVSSWATGVSVAELFTSLSRLLVERPQPPDLSKIDAAIRALVSAGVIPSEELPERPEGEPSVASVPEPPPSPEEEPGGQRGRLTAKQLTAWRQHVLNAHLPYRKDCRACVRGLHRVTAPPHSFSLSYDVAGPFAEKGVTDQGSGFKYVFVAGLRVPKDILPGSQSAFKSPLLEAAQQEEEGGEPVEEESMPYEPSEVREEEGPVSECPSSSDYGELADLAYELIALANQCKEDSGPARVCKITGPLPDTQPLPPLPPARQVVASLARFPMAEFEAFMDDGVDPVEGLTAKTGGHP